MITNCVTNVPSTPIPPAVHHVHQTLLSLYRMTPRRCKTYQTTARSECRKSRVLAKATTDLQGTMQPMVKWWWVPYVSEEMIQEAGAMAAKKSKFSDR
jgi:hypothetical protein